MRVRLNGEYYQTHAANVAELVRELDAPLIGVAVAVNGSVVRKAEHSSRTLQENDDIELIRAVQGG